MQAGITRGGTRHKPLAATPRAGWMLEPGLADSHFPPPLQKPLPMPWGGGCRVGGHGVGSCPSSRQAPQQHQQQPSAPCCCAVAQGEERCRRCAGGCVLTAPPLLLNPSQDGAAGPLQPVDGDRPRAAPADCEPSAPLSRSPGKCAAAAGAGVPSTSVWHS